MDVPESQESTDNTKSELNPQDGDDNFHGLLPGIAAHRCRANRFRFDNEASSRNSVQPDG